MTTEKKKDYDAIKKSDKKVGIFIGAMVLCFMLGVKLYKNHDKKSVKQIKAINRLRKDYKSTIGDVLKSSDLAIAKVIENGLSTPRDSVVFDHFLVKEFGSKEEDFFIIEKTIDAACGRYSSYFLEGISIKMIYFIPPEMKTFVRVSSSSCFDYSLSKNKIIENSKANMKKGISHPRMTN